MSTTAPPLSVSSIPATRGSISTPNHDAFQPRASTSSARSKPSAADFEAVLKNTQTIFLSGSNAISEESPSRLSQHEPTSHAEERSFEDDLNKGVTPNKYGPGAGIGGGPASSASGSTWRAGLGFGNRDRRESSATQNSGMSGSSGGSPSKIFKTKGPAVGLDAEIAAQSPAIQKRRSIFRSAATASSPDLGTLVRRTKKAEPPLPTITAGSSKLGKPPPFATSPAAPRTQGSFSGRSFTSQVSNGSGGVHGEDGWDKHGSQGGPSRMETIRENANGNGRQYEAPKSMAERARGVFGRLFGSSSKSSPASNRRAVSSSAHLPVDDPFAASPTLPPPLPKSPIVSSPPPPSDVFGTISPVSPTAATLRGNAESARGSPYTVRAATPTGRTSPGFSDAKREAADPPSESRLPSKPSGHAREPAMTESDVDAPHVPTPSIARTTSTFTQDVAGALADIGQKSPARELAQMSEQIKPNGQPKEPSKAISLETMRAAPLATIDRERSVSAEVPSTAPVVKGLPAVAERTSSLLRTNPSSSDVEIGPSNQSGSSSTKGHTVRRVPPPSAEPAAPSSSDFGQTATVHEDKEAEKVASQAASPPQAASIRLVGSPKPHVWPPAYNDPSQEKLEDSPAVSPQVDLTEDGDETEVVPSIQTPDGGEEDDEEKGRRLACEFLEENWSSVAWDKVAMFLGGPRPVNAIALRYYMQYFDMKGQNLVESFRDLCAKLHLKAESQEIDRIIEGFSARYYECNPNTVFGTTGVVHTVTGAMLMLNTDLHIADLAKHMSRADFVRNAMRAIQESMPSNDGTSTPDLVRDDSSRFGSVASMGTPTQDLRSKPLPSIPSADGPPQAQRSISAPVIAHAAQHGSSGDGAVIAPGLEKARGSTFSVGSATYSKAWEVEAENALRDIYTAVRADKILLPISAMPSARPSMTSLNGSYPYDLGRKGTIRSPSDRVNALKRASMRGSPFLNNPYGSGFSSSDGRLSPTPSYATSINETAHLHATLGFASNLTHSVIREQEDEVRSIHSESSTATLDELTDDELALLGAPWAKEGMLHHKLYWESAGKRAKKHEWKQFFVVVSKGELFMFTFGDSGSKGAFTGGKVGGGNWLTTANPVGTIDLMHTLASTLPKPGYNVDRPYCFSLVAANGQTTIFQAGTADLVHEWVSTCNYWAGRRSRQPLAGGVSNMEYGWQRVQGLSGAELLKLDDDHASVRSGKSNISKLGGTYSRNRSFGPGDRMHINDWKPPIPASLPSPLEEEAQLDSLQSFVKSLDTELDEHRALQEPMNRQYTQGSKNATKARDNWKARLSYLQTEVTKYDAYIDALKSAIAQRVKEQGKRKLEKSLARSNASLHRRDSEDMLSSLAVGVEAGASSSPVTPRAKAR